MVRCGDGNRHAAMRWEASSSSGSLIKTFAGDVGLKWPMKVDVRSTMASDMKIEGSDDAAGDGDGLRGRLVDMLSHRERVVTCQVPGSFWY